MSWIRRYLSLDDLISVMGYVFISVFARVVNPRMDLAFGSAMASGMLAIFWLASGNVRQRNADRKPNLRVLTWAAVAVASVVVVASR